MDVSGLEERVNQLAGFGFNITLDRIRCSWFYWPWGVINPCLPWWFHCLHSRESSIIHVKKVMHASDCSEKSSRSRLRLDVNDIIRQFFTFPPRIATCKPRRYKGDRPFPRMVGGIPANFTGHPSPFLNRFSCKSRIHSPTGAFHGSSLRLA